MISGLTRGAVEKELIYQYFRLNVIRGLMNLWTNFVQAIVRADSDINAFIRECYGGAK